jgi:glycosyltransferase involved in cell wall biosynthesis
VRILFLSQLLPLPLDAGPKIRSYYVLRHLKDAGHDVTLACFTRPTDRTEHVRELERLCDSVEAVPLVRSRARDLYNGLCSLASNTPFLVLRDQIQAMDDRLRRLSERSFDAVHVDQLWMAPYVHRCAGIALRVLDQHNAVFRVPERLAANRTNPLVRTLLRYETRKMERYERRTFDDFGHVVWVSDEDRQAFPALNGAASHQVIPIAVDTKSRTPIRRSCPFRVTFLGGIHWPPNAEGVRWFARHAWPHVLRAVPNAVLTVVGKGSVGTLGTNTTASNVVVTGYLSDTELSQVLVETAVFVVPLLTGAGMRVKILDAWSWGLPIVSTTVGAEGVRATHGENMLIADHADQFATEVIRVLQDGALATRLSTSGRDTVESLYDWRSVYQAWDRVYH